MGRVVSMSNEVRQSGPRPRASAVLRRLVREARVSLCSAWAALGCIIGEVIVDTGVIPVLLALVFLAVAPSPAALEGRAPAGSADWPVVRVLRQ